MRHTPQERCSLISDPLVQCSLNRRSDALANKSARGSRSVRLSAQIGLAQRAREQSPRLRTLYINPRIFLSKAPQASSKYVPVSSCTPIPIRKSLKHPEHQTTWPDPPRQECPSASPVGVLRTLQKLVPQK